MPCPRLCSGTHSVHATLLALLLSIASSSGGHFVRLEYWSPEGAFNSSIVRECQELAPGVSYCNELDVGRDVVVTIRSSYIPSVCERKVKKDSMLLMHYTARVAADEGADEGSSWIFDEVSDWTNSAPIRLGSGEHPQAWSHALEGMCEGQRASLVVPPELGYTGGSSAASGGRARKSPPSSSSTLLFDVEIVSILTVAPDGNPFPPNVFRILDLDKDQRLSLDEVEAHWSNINRARPSNVMADDADNDGYISWDEFTGPKGTSAD